MTNGNKTKDLHVGFFKDNIYVLSKITYLQSRDSFPKYCTDRNWETAVAIDLNSGEHNESMLLPMTIAKTKK